MIDGSWWCDDGEQWRWQDGRRRRWWLLGGGAGVDDELHNRCRMMNWYAYASFLSFFNVFNRVLLYYVFKKKLKNLVCPSGTYPVRIPCVSEASKPCRIRIRYFFLFKNNDLTDILPIRISERIESVSISGAIRHESSHFLNIGAS
jgi:hypothetical protein